MKLKASVVSLSEKIKELSGKLIQEYPELLDKELEEVLSEAEIIEVAEKIESIRKYKIKDYESAIIFFTNEMLEIYKETAKEGKIIDKKQTRIFDVGQKLLEKTKKLRREKNRQTSQFDTNILSHAPFFAGGSTKRKEKAAKEGQILVDKGGLRKMTYQNDLGELLSCNDAKTLAALFALWGEQDMGEKVTFTEYQLLEKLNIGIGGKQYSILRDSLNKLRNTSIVLQEAYIVSEKKRIVTERFPLIIAEGMIVDEELTEEEKLSGITLNEKLPSLIDAESENRNRRKEFSVSFSPYIHKSFKDGYCTLISLAVFDELETEAAKALYLMISGMQDMIDNECYVKLDGTLEIPIETVYDTLFLENAKAKNKITVEKACSELKHIDVISDFYFTGKGRTVNSLVIEPSEWLNEVLTSDKLALEKRNVIGLN